MTVPKVIAHWAWISKDPAVGIGYGVLKASAGEVDFGALIGRYVPGSPSSSTPETAPDAPPWLTLGPADDSHRDVLMSVSVRDPWKERDHTGRPVWPQRLFAMRFADLATANASFQTIWEAVRGTEIPERDRAPLSLPIQPQSPTALLPLFEKYGFATIAALAAALLDAPVAIADAGHLTREERLEVLDAVAALLPYGIRADLSVSSSVNNTVEHGIRLVFAKFANEGQQLLSLLDNTHPHGSELSQQYLASLLEREQSCGLPKLLDHLWTFNNKQPCFFSQPAEALALLKKLDYIGGTIRELASGLITANEITEFLNRDGAGSVWDGLDEVVRENALTSLFAADSPHATDALVRSWKFFGDDVIRRINFQLDAGHQELASHCLRAFAASKSGEDRLLGDLLVPSERIAEGDRWVQRFTMLVGLLRNRPVPAPGSYRYACHQLRFGEADGWQARLVRELLSRELSDPDTANRALGWMDWLCTSPFTERWERPYWLAAMDFLLPGAVAEQAVSSLQALIRRDAVWAVTMLRLARRTDRLGPLLSAASVEFVELIATAANAGPGRADRELAEELSLSARNTALPPTSSAHLDVVLALLGPTPRYLPGVDDKRWFDAYLSGLHEALDLPAVQPSVAILERRFLDYAVSRTEDGQLTPQGVHLLNAWAADPAREGGFLGYLASLTEADRPQDYGLEGRYWDTVSRHPALRAYAAVGDLVLTTDWTVQRPDVAFQRSDRAGGVTSSRLARACFDASKAGLPVTEIIRTLATGGARNIDPPNLDDVLREFQGLLFQFIGKEASERALFECYKLIVGDAKLGTEYAESFHGYLDARLEVEIRTRQDLQKVLKELSGRRARANRTTNPLARLIQGTSRRNAAQQDADQSPTLPLFEHPVEDHAHRP
jgi:hypothetical protein